MSAVCCCLFDVCLLFLCSLLFVVFAFVCGCARLVATVVYRLSCVVCCCMLFGVGVACGVLCGVLFVGVGCCMMFNCCSCVWLNARCSLSVVVCCLLLVVGC